MTTPRTYRVRAADGIRLALHRLAPERQLFRTPVLLMPGTFSTRAFWLGTRGHGLGRTVAGAGFDTWILEPRGHGDSERPRRWTIADWIELDAPAAARAVLEHSGQEEFLWVGHSAGGVVGAAFAGSDAPVARGMRGLALFGAPGPDGVRGWRRWMARGSALLTSPLPTLRVPGRPFGMGPEAEPGALVHAWMRWNLDGRWTRAGGGDYLAALPRVRIPLLAVGGDGDPLLAPPAAVRGLAERFGSADRTVVIAGRDTGFAADYGHADLLVSRSAREEIWPLLLGWLAEHAERPVPNPAPENLHSRGG